MGELEAASVRGSGLKAWARRSIQLFAVLALALQPILPLGNYLTVLGNDDGLPVGLRGTPWCFPMPGSIPGRDGRQPQHSSADPGCCACTMAAKVFGGNSNTESVVVVRPPLAAWLRNPQPAVPRMAPPSEPATARGPPVVA